jgi:rSAM/selenodomain-associated transferase 2
VPREAKAVMPAKLDHPATGRKPLLAIVVPALNEADRLGGLLADLAGLGVAHETIVVDGGSTDATAPIAAAGGARVLHSPAGRGAQLRAGAAAARAPLLCFLHADARLDPRGLRELARLALAPPAAACAFRLRIAGRRASYRLVETGANLRARWLCLPYGDQGLVVRREDYERAGGYPPYPLMEDVALVRSLRRFTPIRLLDAEVRVSARRWRRDGVLRRTLLNLTLLLRYLAGAHPERLAASYRRGGRP